jgi:hypothetical protein
MNTAMNVRVPYNFGKFLGSWTTSAFSRRAQLNGVFFLYYCLVCEAIATAATPGLLCQPRVIVKMIVEKQMECRLAGEPKFSEETCPSATFINHKIPNDQTRV